jgi:hypothetical protein
MAEGSRYAFTLQQLEFIRAFLAAPRHSPRAGILVLAGASLFFYSAWQPVYLLLLIASAAMNFSLGSGMEDPLRRSFSLLPTLSSSKRIGFHNTCGLSSNDRSAQPQRICCAETPPKVDRRWAHN